MKKYIIIGTIGAVLGIGYWLIPEKQIGATIRLDKIDAIPTTTTIDGKDISVEFTDDNIGEDFIIKSDKENYHGMGIISPIISITNVSNQDQDIEVVFSLNGEKREILKIERPVGTIVTPPQYVAEVVNKDSGTSTPAYTIATSTKTTWAELSVADGDTSSTITRKDILNYTTQDKTDFSISSGETIFLRLTMRFPYMANDDEWFIEAFGSKGAYGHLDPAYLTDDFDAYNTAAINGQGGWVDDGQGAVTVESGADKQGTWTGNALGFAYSPFDDGGSGATGNQIWYMQLTVGHSGGAGIGGLIMDGTTWGTNNICRVWFDHNVTDVVLAYNGGTEIMDASYQLSRWYKIEMEWDAEKGTNGQCRARMDDGDETFGSWTDWREAYHDFDTASHFGVRSVGDGWSQTINFDDLQPAGAAPSASPPKPQPMISEM